MAETWRHSGTWQTGKHRQSDALVFLGYIVQSAIIGEIDPDTAAKGIEGLIPRQALPRR
jgi:hypothetical protein